jgi:hypothetical protein
MPQACRISPIISVGKSKVSKIVGCDHADAKAENAGAQAGGELRQTKSPISDINPRNSLH